MVMEVMVAVGGALVALLAFLLGDRLRPAGWRQSSDESSGTLVFDLIKTFFAAIVAFVVVICWQQYDNARGRTVAEANALIETYWAAHSMPGPEREQIQQQVHDYTTSVVTQEWPVMDRDQRLDPQTQATFDRLRDTVQQLRPADPYESTLRANALSGLDKVADARHYRANSAAHGIPGFLYVALYIAAALLLLSPVLSGVRVSRRSVVMIALLGVVIGSVLLQIHNLDHPFAGGDVVPADTFRLALEQFQPTTGPVQHAS
ncbi:bestrophin-like domain [Nocardia stercoris]|uniref:DUF4239 domain-containing protein n=1 Tax=Nocardia stercoris TaxID=2483361 RepID=A0A3M2L8M5_9NOCA|nr:DUF4239 domain-containing protein [Nocardia stercoris]RMI32873.1 DUF4239 domain-containing protein [Nocardia stercoris]